MSSEPTPKVRVKGPLRSAKAAVFPGFTGQTGRWDDMTDVALGLGVASPPKLAKTPSIVYPQGRRALTVPKKTYLVRVFVDVDRHPAEVVTVYRTTKISKYWREES